MQTIKSLPFGKCTKKKEDGEKEKEIVIMIIFHIMLHLFSSKKCPTFEKHSHLLFSYLLVSLVSRVHFTMRTNNFVCIEQKIYVANVYDEVKDSFMQFSSFVTFLFIFIFSVTCTDQSELICITRHLFELIGANLFTKL